MSRRNREVSTVGRRRSACRAVRRVRERRRGPKPKPVFEHPEPLFTSWIEPDTFSDSLALHMRRHSDSCWHLCKAVVRPREHFDRGTLQSWVAGERVPRTARSMSILARIEKRYRLPAGHFKALLPHAARATTRQPFVVGSAGERRRLAWHLPDDFGSRTAAERAHILEWVRTNILAGSTDYRRFQAEARKHRYALCFPKLAGHRTGGCRGEADPDNVLIASADLWRRWKH